MRWLGMGGAGGGVAAGMALAVVAAAFGGPEVLSVASQAVAEPGPGQARIQVRAAGVNPVDWKSYSGVMGADPARLPIRPGAEAAGVVLAAGPGAAGPVVAGDEVIAFRVSAYRRHRVPGAYASELVVPAQALVPKPPALDWPQAAGLMLTGATAWHALEVTGVGKGDTVLVHGAAGGVGVMAVQLAAARGATVVGTASPARHSFLRELGAVPVTYGRGTGGARARRSAGRNRRRAGPGGHRRGR